MSAPAAAESHRPVPRPPRPAQGPLLLHTPQGTPSITVRGDVQVELGPAWVKAEPPRYHLEDAGRLVEPSHEPSMAVKAPQETSKVRCPKCRETFPWTTERPTSVLCPHCGAKGRLK
jgi:hypothetical protein